MLASTLGLQTARLRRGSGEPSNLTIIDAIRGLAALAVAWYHLTSLPLLTLPYLKASGEFGWLGVHAFFVVSGFVIPYAMHRAGYSLKHFATFLWKRLLRLHPPYLATLALLIAGGLITSQPMSGPSILAHLAYLNTFFGIPWRLDIFWTLAIEFQFYIAVALFFPILGRRGWSTFLILLSALAAASLPNGDFLPHYAPIFLSGLVVFRYKAGLITATTAGLSLAAAALLSASFIGYRHAGVALATSFVILFVTYSNPLLQWLGDLSYSLYLTHTFVIELTVRAVISTLGSSLAAQAIAIISSMLAAFAVATFMHRFVERPSREASSSIRYR